MHIPDGFLDLKTALGTNAVAAGAVAVTLRTMRRRLTSRQVPLMGLTATFVFAAQMLNFPVAGGTSGHLLGAALAAVLVGPGAAVLVMTAVLVVQCLVFADGGLLALGANVLNMAIIGGLGGGIIYRAVARASRGLRGQVTAAAFAAWCSVVLAAAACALELSLAGTVPLSLVLPAMVTVHMIIGVGEAVITALVLVAIAAIRPELVVRDHPSRASRPLQLLLGGALVALCLAVVVAPFASSLPDGLERVASTLGFAGRATAAIAAPLADYHVPGMAPSVAATAVAGAIGTLIMLGASLLLGRLLVPGGGRPGPGAEV